MTDFERDWAHTRRAAFDDWADYDAPRERPTRADYYDDDEEQL